MKIWKEFSKIKQITAMQSNSWASLESHEIHRKTYISYLIFINFLHDFHSCLISFSWFSHIISRISYMIFMNFICDFHLLLIWFSKIWFRIFIICCWKFMCCLMWFSLLSYVIFYVIFITSGCDFQDLSMWFVWVWHFIFVSLWWLYHRFHITFPLYFQYFPYSVLRKCP